MSAGHLLMVFFPWFLKCYVKSCITLDANVFLHLRLASFSPERVYEGFLDVTSQKSWLIKGFSLRKRRLLQEAEKG